jgi:serine/threonine protein kinase
MYLLPDTELNNRYKIAEVLGHGGFGITYSALDKILNVKVAIKEYLPRQLATRAEGQTKVSIFTGESRKHYNYGLKKFLEEAQSIAQFSHHPNIVSARDYFETNNTAYMVMEYIEGVTLKEYLGQKGGRIPFHEAKAIMMPVIDALREVHSAGLLHRDISPDNIFLTITRQVKLIDFGAARYQAGEQSKSLSVILKIGYAPEEQYRSSGRQGPWTDVYAVAATLFKTITGQTPPDALDRLEDDTLVPPSQLGVTIPPQAEHTLLKALAVRASDRFQTVDEFKAGLILSTSFPNTQVTAPMSAPEVRPSMSIPKPRPAARRSLKVSILVPIICMVFVAMAGIAAWSLLKDRHKTEVKPQLTTALKPSEFQPVPVLKDELGKVLSRYKKALEAKDNNELRGCFSPHFSELGKKMKEIETNWTGFDFLDMTFNIEIKNQELNNVLTLVKWQFQTRNLKSNEINPHSLTNQVTFSREEGQWRIKAIEKSIASEN